LKKLPAANGGFFVVCALFQHVNQDSFVGMQRHTISQGASAWPNCPDIRVLRLMQSQIQKPERLERLILMMAIALYWAVSCGMFAENQAANSGQKRGPSRKSSAR
jgi:hypothetical protein